MIDYFALALGHGLLAVSLLRLVWRDDLDVDPLLHTLKEEERQNRKAASVAGRNARRRAAREGDGPSDDERLRSSSVSDSAENNA
ncbi:MAG: hypothetical protein AAF941_02345 [Pseudomonadota bacterium]